MLTRDSAVWWLGIIGALVAYLGTAGNPANWHYEQYVQLAAFLVGTISGKLATSPLPHSVEGSAQVTPDGR